MRLHVTAGIAVLASLIPNTSGLPTGFDVGHSAEDNATEFALIYGYPLIPYTRFALPLLAKSPPNTLLHMRRLATADFQDVVRANVDTLYSALIVDLSHHDLILDVPSISDRYWVFPFYDVYGNNYASLGSTSNTTAGKFLVRYAPAVGEEPGIQLCQSCPGYSGFINAPTLYGTFMGRMLVKDNGTDLDTVHGIQNRTGLYAVAIHGRREERHQAPPLSVEMLNSSLPQDTASRIMHLIARINPHNPPRNITDLPRVKRQLQAAGIQHGHYEPSIRNLTTVAERAIQSVKAAVAKAENGLDLDNGWRGLNPAVQGDFDLAYKMRAYVCNFGYLALTATEALYPTYYGTSTRDGDLNLQAHEAFIITLASKPPLETDGFWSLTAYNGKQYLIDNRLDRYALGDRSSLSYPDGTHVYGGESNEKNQPFQLLVQPTDIQPPENWTSNWLPAPAGGGNFTITLRFYSPKQSLANGSWLYPMVQKHSALTR